MDLETRMTRITFVLLMSALLPAVCLAQGRGAPDAGGESQAARAAARFFYTVPAELGDEWEYAWPECSLLPAPASVGLKDCEAFEGNGNHQACSSSKYVELTNVLTKEKRKFMLIYHVFSTKKACVKDRKEGLTGHS